MNLVDKFVLRSITIYQQIKKVLPQEFTRGCRFVPSCSFYTYIAIERYGTIKGLFLGFKRIIRCHPFSKGGKDPLK